MSPTQHYKNIACMVLLLCCWAFSSSAQIITTIAGDGTMTISGDGGPATLAGIHQPGHLRTDISGNLYLCGSALVRKIDNMGIITAYAGGGTGADGSPATAAYIGGASGISTDASGNMHVGGSCRVRKIDASGIISTVAGTGTCGYTGDAGPATAAQLPGIIHTAFDAAGNLYITGTGFIRMVNTAGIIRTIAGNNGPGFSGDGGPATAAQMGILGHVAPDVWGNVYFSDATNHRIRKIDAAGIINTIAGNGLTTYSGDGGPATAASLNNPSALALDAWGNLYVCDNVLNRVRRIDPAGIITTIAGTGTIGYSGDGGPATAAEFNGIIGIAINLDGDIFLSDGNRRIRKISSWNSRPWFTPGATVTFTACGEYNPTDTLLRVMDSNATQPITWSLLSPPAHGAAVAAYSATATGSVLTPTGTGYTPTGGYTGPDTFKVRVFDGGAYDTITVAIDVQAAPVAGPITGADTLCVGDTAPLSAPATGGVWSSPSGTATVSATGMVTGVSAGTAVITYVVTNACGTATATHTVTVLPAAGCPTGISQAHATSAISISPNPTTGTLTLHLPQATPAHITITDVTGRLIHQLTATGATTTINMPPGSGMYFITASMAYGRYYGKVVVR